MKERLRIRVYNVRFGDAILVSVPDRKQVRHILIDVGNVQTGVGGAVDVYDWVIEDLKRELKDKPVDLYVMTHEHMDHVKGLLYASDQLGVKLEADYAWLTASAAPDYYERFTEAHKQKRLAEQAFESARLSVLSESAWAALMLNNDYRSTAKCVDHLRTIAAKTAYIHRESKLKGTHPFREAVLKVWAPEEDTSEYYGTFHPSAFLMSVGGNHKEMAQTANPLPPAGVDLGAFVNLVNWRGRGHGDNLLTIDRAANNTSIVFSLEWRGWTLLFAGDAEIRSWRTMEKYKMLQPVHFLKVAHHGSDNGTPDSDLLEKILPRKAPDKRERRAVISTCLDTYPGVPDSDVVSRLSERCTVHSILDLPEEEKWLDFFFDG